MTWGDLAGIGSRSAVANGAPRSALIVAAAICATMGLAGCGERPSEGTDDPCAPGLTDCGEHGCQSLGTVEHCSACGDACSAPDNAEALCLDGACTWTCLAGYGNCDENPETGCEAALEDGACPGDVETPTAHRVVLVFSKRALWQCVDARNERFGVRDGLASLLERADVDVALVLFGTSPEAHEFPVAVGDLETVLDPAGPLAPSSDLQGALVATAELLSTDVAGADSEQERHYHVVVVEASRPSPMCPDGCPGGEPPLCGVHPDEHPGDFVDREEPCSAYNQPDTLLPRLQQLVQTVTSEGATIDIRLVLAANAIEDIDTVCPNGVFGIADELAAAEGLYTQLAASIAEASYHRVAPSDLSSVLPQDFE